MAADANGYTYVAGTSNTYSPVPPTSTIDTPDAFVAKLDPLGNVVWTVYFGGSGYDSATSIALDNNGNIYVAGVTYSLDFPVKDPITGFKSGPSCTGTVAPGCADAFVVKLDSSGTIVYATYLGGSNDDRANGIAVDPLGNAYITGSTSSADFPTLNPVQPSFGGATDAFVAKLNAAGNALVYSTYLGGSVSDQGNGIAVDSNGNAYVAGWTASNNFPVYNALEASHPGLDGVPASFMAKLTAAGSAFVYSTYFDASGAAGIAVDAGGDAFVALTKDRGLEALKLNPSGSAVVYETPLVACPSPCSSGELLYAGGIAVDTNGNAAVIGTLEVPYRVFVTDSAVLATVDPQGKGQVFPGQLLGGPMFGTIFVAAGTAVAFDPNGNVAVAGYNSGQVETAKVVYNYPQNCHFSVTGISAQNFSPLGGNGTATLVSSGPNCVPIVTSNSPWLQINLANSAMVSFAVASGATTTRMGTLTIAGQPFTITQTVPPTSLPVSVSPSSGSGQQQTFTATYNNASSVVSVYFMISSVVQAQSSCFAEYDIGPNQFQLITDSGANGPPITPGSGSSSNSQCTLSGVGAAATITGSNLTVTFPLTFAAGYAGAKNVYLFALSQYSLNSGWQQLGSWTVTTGGGIPPGAIPVCNPSGAPCVASLSPANGSGPSGTFTGVFTHSGGASQHYLGYILFLPTPNIVWYTATGSCLVEYNRISNAMRLINDAGNNWLPGTIGLPIGQAGTLTNSHCSLNVGQSSATINGTVMTVNAAVTFNAVFTGQLATFMQAFDVTGAYTGMTQFGNWMVSRGTQEPGPYIVNLSPSSGAGSSTTLTFTTGHSSGVSSLSFVTMLISSVIVGGTPCQAFYWPSTNILNLVDDSGTAMVSTNGITVGTAGTLSNSRCTINTSAATSSVSGNNVTVSLPMTFSTANFGGTQSIYLNAFDNFGKLSHWVTSGTWTVQ